MNKWHLRHIPNLTIRILTGDSFYICEECGKAHKRDGNEIRLDRDSEHLMSHQLWYGSVSKCCFDKQQQRVWKALREATEKKLFSLL